MPLTSGVWSGGGWRKDGDSALCFPSVLWHCLGDRKDTRPGNKPVPNCQLSIKLLFQSLPSVFWHCWLGVRNSIRPVKNWVMRCWHGYLPGARCKWFAYGSADTTAIPSFPASSKSRLVISFLLLAYPCCPGKDAIKWVSVSPTADGGKTEREPTNPGLPGKQTLNRMQGLM